jgi:hypothetical protein
MASPDEIARDLVAAWLSHNPVPLDTANPTRTADTIITLYKAVAAALQGPDVPAASAAPGRATAPEQRRRPR